MKNKVWAAPPLKDCHFKVHYYILVTIFKWKSCPHFVFQWRSRQQVNLVWRSRPYVNLLWRSRPQIQGKLFIFDGLFSKSCGCYSFSVIFTKPRPPIFLSQKKWNVISGTFQKFSLLRGVIWRPREEHFGRTPCIYVQKLRTPCTI